MLIHIIVNAKSAREESMLLKTLTTAECAKKLVAAALPPVGPDQKPSVSRDRMQLWTSWFTYLLIVPTGVDFSSIWRKGVLNARSVKRL